MKKTNKLQSFEQIKKKQSFLTEHRNFPKRFEKNYRFYYTN